MGSVIAFKAKRSVWSQNDIKQYDHPTVISLPKSLREDKKKLDHRIKALRKVILSSGLSVEYISEKAKLCTSTVTNLLNGKTMSPHCRSILQLMDFCTKERLCEFGFQITAKPSHKIAQRA